MSCEYDIPPPNEWDIWLDHGMATAFEISVGDVDCVPIDIAGRNFTWQFFDLLENEVLKLSTLDGSMWTTSVVGQLKAQIDPADWQGVDRGIGVLMHQLSMENPAASGDDMIILRGKCTVKAVMPVA